jgi:hypothetical protein
MVTSIVTWSIALAISVVMLLFLKSGSSLMAFCTSIAVRNAE